MSVRTRMQTSTQNGSYNGHLTSVMPTTLGKHEGARVHKR